MATIIRSLAVNVSVLSAAILLFCLLHTTRTELVKSSRASVPPLPTTTSTTPRPRPHKPGLSLPLPNRHAPKCLREVPAIFSQTEKDVPIVGNSSTNPHLNVVEVCCLGYKRYSYDWSKCVPDCGEKCQHGFCLEGGVCQCFDEFVLNHHNNCVPTCPLGCPNGQCYLNGTCVCDRGYELDPTKTFCMAICELGCGRNELCVAPNTCVCADGYARSSPDSLMGCQPICIPNCGFGHCVAPNQCECFKGYVKRTNGFSCESSDCYMRCENGFCVNRDTCICQDGYRYDNYTSTCLPDCGDDCDNGVCISPGVCRCFNGYVRTGAKCEAVCERGCGFYGKCVAPNVCGCAVAEGPLKSYQFCDSGSCNAVGRCRCQPGTTRFINRCLEPDQVTTYAAMHHLRLNASLVDEYDLLIGRHFLMREDPLIYSRGRN